MAVFLAYLSLVLVNCCHSFYDILHSYLKLATRLQPIRLMLIDMNVIYMRSWYSFLLLILLLGKVSVRAYGQDSSRYHVRHYDEDDGMPQNTVKGLVMDSKGYLWILTESGLTRFDGHRFVNYNQLPDGTKLTKRVASLHLSHNDTVFFADANERFWRTGAAGQLHPYTPSDSLRRFRDRALQVVGWRINDLCYRKVLQGLLPGWVMPVFRLNNINNGKGLSRIGGFFYWFNSSNEIVRSDTALTHFDRVWLPGLPLLADAAAQVRMVPHNDRLVVQWGENLYVAQPVAGTRWRVEQVVHTGKIGAITQWLPSPMPRIFYIATLTDGLYQYTRQEFSTKTFTGNAVNVFYALAPYGAHDVVTDKGVVTGSAAPQLDSFRAFTVLKRKEGGYVFSKWGHPLINGLSFRDDLLRPQHFLPLPDPAIGQLYELSDGSICMAALKNYFGRWKEGKVEWFTRPGMQRPDSLEKFQVTSLAEIKPGLVWIGGHNGLGRFDLHTQAFEPVLRSNALEIRVIYLDKTGILWIGTYGNGFYACMDDRIIKMPLDRDGYLSHVHAFIEDSNGFCWISTNKGLFQVRMEAMRRYVREQQVAPYYHYYDKSNGFLTNEFNGGGTPAVVVTGDGYFSFPSMQGIVQFDPQVIEPVLSTSQLYIDRIVADGAEVVPDPAKLVLPNGVQRLEFQVSSPFWGTPNNHRIEYKLQGGDSAWHPLREDGMVAFDRLPRGKYALQFRKQAGFNQEVNSIVQAFTIAPAFYETWWFRVLMGGLLILLLWLLIRFRLHYLLRRQRWLEQEVAYRTNEQRRLIYELELTVADLETSQTELGKYARLLEMLGITMTHDLQSPLRFLTEVSAMLHASAKETAYADLEMQSRELLQASRKIHHFVKDFGYWLKSLENRIVLQQEPVELDKLLNELQHFSIELFRQHGNQLVIECPPGITVSSDRQLLQIILRNLIDNANKYTKAGKVTVVVKRQGQMVSLAIMDSGKGFKVDTLLRVRQLLQSSFHTINDMEGKGGFGYYFITEFCRLLGIRLQADNLPGKGAIVLLDQLKLVTTDAAVSDQNAYYDPNTIGG